jgi:hypothetical protein
MSLIHEYPDTPLSAAAEIIQNLRGSVVEPCSIANSLSHGDWLKPVSYEQSLDLFEVLALSHAIEAGPMADELAKLVLARDYRSLCDYELNYTAGHDALHYASARQCLAFFQKCEPLDLGIDKKQVAFEKFVEAELACAKTNTKFDHLTSGKLQMSGRASSMLHIAARKIAGMLDKVLAKHGCDDVWDAYKQTQIRFGPGATSSVKAQHANPSVKLGARLECSNDLLPCVEKYMELVPALLQNHRHVSSSLYSELETADLVLDSTCEVFAVAGKLSFVPKSAKTNRSIVVPPHLNSLFQRGYGLLLREALSTVGIDLQDQTANQQAARIASLTGQLATVDLSSASDTLSTAIVWELLPYDWVSAMSEVRSSTVTYVERKGKKENDTIVLFPDLQKFGSMGDAFTFELETLIFYGLTYAACVYSNADPRPVTVYGDDIICPTAAVDNLFYILQYCGFKVNSEKSFWEGGFRESCGKDFFGGIDIRPYYQRELASGQTLFSLHNHYVRTFDDERARMIASCIPEALRLWGPAEYGDGHLHVRDYRILDAILRPHRREDQWSGYVFDTFKCKNQELRKPGPGMRTFPTYSIYVSRGSDANWEEGYLPFTGVFNSQRGRADRERFLKLLYEAVPSNPTVVRGVTGYKRISIYTLR